MTTDREYGLPDWMRSAGESILALLPPGWKFELKVGTDEATVFSLEGKKE